MAAINLSNTAQLQSGTQHIPNTWATVPTIRSVQAAPRLLDWLVRLTERAHALAARCGVAQAQCGFAPWGAGAFLSDAAGGGSRSFEAARALSSRSGQR
ncbi:MAG: hypothetical protein JO133_12340 [Burkholderiaceae bacterium]|nr:hypothetical protein [Burkholderiaceae bacterium]